MKTTILNSFSHLIVNAKAYFNAAFIIREEEIKATMNLNELRKLEQPITTLPPLFLFKPRDHLFAIAIELLGKSIINEYEKSKDPSKVPDMISHGHKLVKIYIKAREYLNTSGLLDNFNKNKEEILLNKLTEIILWASRYHYSGTHENHIKKIIHKSGTGIDNAISNLVLTDKEVNDAIILFEKYYHLHNQMSDNIYKKLIAEENNI